MRRWLILGLFIVPLIVAGCSKGPAETALKVADEAVAKVKPEAEKYVPDQFKTLSEAASSARAKFDQGDYKGALAEARALPDKANDVMAAAAAKKEELTALWNGLERSLPAAVAAVTDKLNALASMKRLPTGFSQNQLEAAKAQLAEVTGLWTKATGAFSGGDLPGALQLGDDTKVKAEELAKLLEPVVQPKK